MFPLERVSSAGFWSSGGGIGKRLPVLALEQSPAMASAVTFSLTLNVWLFRILCAKPARKP